MCVGLKISTIIGRSRLFDEHFLLKMNGNCSKKRYELHLRYGGTITARGIQLLSGPPWSVRALIAISTKIYGRAAGPWAILMTD